MSRIANYPVDVPEKVEVTISSGAVSVKGPLGALSQHVGDQVQIERVENQLLFKPANNSQQANAMSGTARALVFNMVNGVTKGWEKKLSLVGVGYRAQAAGDVVNLTLGFSHPVAHKMPEGVKVETPTQTEIVVKGADCQKVGQVSAEIREIRPPEPYKGKGVRYANEQISLKEGKKK